MAFINPVPELTNEEEEALIDYFATKVVAYGMEVPAITLLEGLTPMSKFAAEIPLLFASPFLEAMGLNSYQYVALFSKREVIEVVIQRIEKLHEEKKITEKAEREKKTSEDKGLIKKIKRFFSRK